MDARLRRSAALIASTGLVVLLAVTPGSASASAVSADLVTEDTSSQTDSSWSIGRKLREPVPASVGSGDATSGMTTTLASLGWPANTRKLGLT